MRDYENLATDEEMNERDRRWVMIPWEEWYGEYLEDTWDDDADNVEYGKYGEVVAYLLDEVSGVIVGRPDGTRQFILEMCGHDMDDEFHVIREALLSGDRGTISDVVNRVQDNVGVWSPTGYGFDYEGWELVVRIE